jgi:hypothetical protein
LFLQAFADTGEIFPQPLDVGVLSRSLVARVVPVRDLNADEDAHDDDDEVEHDRCPVLRPYVVDDATQDHVFL